MKTHRAAFCDPQHPISHVFIGLEPGNVPFIVISVMEHTNPGEIGQPRVTIRDHGTPVRELVPPWRAVRVILVQYVVSFHFPPPVQMLSRLCSYPLRL